MNEIKDNECGPRTMHVSKQPSVQQCAGHCSDAARLLPFSFSSRAQTCGIRRH